MAKTKFNEEIKSLRRRFPTEFRSWYGMIRRCYYHSTDGWDNYGGRGIRVCSRWRDSFQLFIDDMGRKPKPHREFSLDRIDVNGDYSPDNCQWANKAVQAWHRRLAKPPVFISHITYNNQTLSVHDWSIITNIPTKTIISRLQHNWSVEKTLTTIPAKEKGKLRAQYKSEYNTWTSMKERCFNTNNPSWPKYGGRGITVCERWKRSFKLFIEDVGPKPTPQHSLDRINNDGNYEPGNVRWATDLEQVRNTRHNVRLTYNGETHCITEWAEISGIDKDSLWSRINRGWSIERALTESNGERATDKRITIDGVTKTLAQWCRDYQISYQAVFDRINRQGMTPEEALSTKKLTRSEIGKIGGPKRHKNPRMLTYNGVTKTLSQWAIEIGISYSAVLNRWKNGLSPEEILSPKLMTMSEAGSKGCHQRWRKHQK